MSNPIRRNRPAQDAKPKGAKSSAVNLGKALNLGNPIRQKKPARAAQPEAPRVASRERLLSWWKTTEGAFTRQQRTEKRFRLPSIAEKMAEPVSPTVAAWPGPRIALIQALFGPGYTTPGSDAAAMAFMEGGGLNAKSRVIELGTGLGGIGRLIQMKTGANLQAYDQNIQLIRDARLQAKAAGISEMAKFHKVSFAKFPEPKRKADLVISKEALFRVADKQALLTTIRKSLLPQGQMVFTDYLLGTKRLMRPHLDAWRKLDQEPLHLIELGQMIWTLQEAGLVLWEAIDITEEYRTQTMTAFADCATAVRRPGIPEAWRKWFLSEGNYWAPRIAALESGDVKVYLFNLTGKKVGAQRPFQTGLRFSAKARGPSK
jgi:2-polyprenyl-3-methyl-5-hydroxy-6-metoxy-1,4-benzoquinol methylase